MTTYHVSDLASKAGTTPSTVRYYEQEGLLPAGRSAVGYRVYGEDAVERLEFIADAKRLGLPLGDIRELLAAWDAGECASLRDRLRPVLEARIAEARQHADEIAALIGQLTAALSGLAAPPVAGRCDPACCLTGPAAGVGDRAAAGDVRPGTPAHGRASVPVPHPGGQELVVGCGLAADSQARRLGEWRDLLAQALQREPVDGGVRLSLPASVAAEAAALAVAEADCCPFLSFTLRPAGGEVLLDVRAPADRLSQLSALLADG